MHALIRFEVLRRALSHRFDTELDLRTVADIVKNQPVPPVDAFLDPRIALQHLRQYADLLRPLPPRAHLEVTVDILGLRAQIAGRKARLTYDAIAQALSIEGLDGLPSHLPEAALLQVLAKEETGSAVVQQAYAAVAPFLDALMEIGAHEGNRVVGSWIDLRASLDEGAGPVLYQERMYADNAEEDNVSSALVAEPDEATSPLSVAPTLNSSQGGLFPKADTMPMRPLLRRAAAMVQQRSDRTGKESKHVAANYKLGLSPRL